MLSYLLIFKFELIKLYKMKKIYFQLNCIFFAFWLILR